MSFDFDKKQFNEQLLAYDPVDPEELTFKSKMLELLEYDNCFERSLLHAHFTGSAWVIDPKAKTFLLTHHAKLNRWLQLGGHADGDANMRNVAFRELTEESGLDQFELFSLDIFDIDIHSIPEKGEVPQHDHYDIRYIFKGDSEKPLQKNHESKELRWVSAKDLDDLIDENTSIKRMLNKSLQMAL